MSKPNDVDTGYHRRMEQAQRELGLDVEHEQGKVDLDSGNEAKSDHHSHVQGRQRVTRGTISAAQHEHGRAPPADDRGSSDSSPDHERRRRRREQRQREKEKGGMKERDYVNPLLKFLDALITPNIEQPPHALQNGRPARPSQPLRRRRSILDEPITSQPIQFINDRYSGIKKENRVRIVDPPTEEEERKPKGILKEPTKAFPGLANTIREGVAPLKDASSIGIPPGARWTKIDRRLVNPQALEEAKERFEERLDCVIVLRVLTKEEIQKLADRTSEMRGERDVEERRDRKVAKRRERRRGGHEPDEYTDSSEDERPKRKPKMLETLGSPEHEAGSEPEYRDEDRISLTELQEPRGADHEKLPDVDANDNATIVAYRDKAASGDVHYQRTDHVGERRRFSTGEDRRSVDHENLNSDNASSYTDPATMYVTMEPKWRAEGLRRSKTSEMRQSSPLDVPGEPSLYTQSAKDLGPSPRTRDALDKPSTVLEEQSATASNHIFPNGETRYSRDGLYTGERTYVILTEEQRRKHVITFEDGGAHTSAPPNGSVPTSEIGQENFDIEPLQSTTQWKVSARIAEPLDELGTEDVDDGRVTCSTPTSASSDSNTAGGMSGRSSTSAISRIDGIANSAGTVPTTVEGNSSANKSGVPTSGEAQHDHDDLRSIQTDNRDIGATVSRHDRKTFGVRFACVSGDSDQPAERPSDILNLPDLDFGRLRAVRDKGLPAEINRARQFLVESEEYQWLLNGIKGTCRLMETGSHIGAMRNQLIDLQDLAAPCFDLNIDWDPVKFLESQYADTPGGTISTTITYNGKGDLIEAVGCEEYVHRMWPLFGGMVLDCVEKAVRDRSGHEYAEVPTSSRDAKVTLKLTLMAPGLFASIEGSSVAKIEIMETLLWLGAACRVSPDREQASVAFPTTSIDDQEEAMLGKPVPKAIDSTRCWSQLVRNPVVVKGYPIARRLHREKGLEIEAGLLTILADSTRAVIFDGALMLTGLCSTLVAVSEANGSILWHYLLGNNSNPVCYNEARKYCKQAAPISFGALSSARHFVGWTDYARVLTGTADANYNIDFAGKPIRAGCALRDVTVGFSKIISMSTKLTPGLKDTRLTYSKPERYKWQVEHAEKMRVVFYDVRDKRAFLIDGTDAILHLSRAYLSSPHAPPFDHNYSAQLVEEFLHRPSSEQKYQDARQILCKSRNRKIAICRVDDSDDGSSVDDAAGSKADPDEMRFEHLVVHFYEILREMQAHQFKIRKSEQWSVPIKNPFVARLEGFGFADMLALPTSLEPRYAPLNISGPSWLEVTDKAGAINILGAGFGDLFSSSSDCDTCTIIPPGCDFLVSSTKILRSIAAFRMGIGERHLELAEGVFWNWPERSCRPSRCDCATTPSHGVRCDVMVTELQAYGVQPPQGKAYLQNKDDLPPAAAVVFGNPEHLKRTRKAMSSAATSMDCQSCILHRRRHMERAVLPHQTPSDRSRSSASGSASIESTQGSTKRDSNASTSISGISSQTSDSQRMASNASAHDHGQQARAGAAASTDTLMHSDYDMATQAGRDDRFTNDTGYTEAVLESYHPRTSDRPITSRPAASVSASTCQRRNRHPNGAEFDFWQSPAHGEHDRWHVHRLGDDRRSNDSARESAAREDCPASEGITYDGPAPLKMSPQSRPGPTSGISPLPASHQHFGVQSMLSDTALPQDTEHLDRSSPQSLADRTSLSFPRLRRKAGSIMRTGDVDTKTGPESVFGRVPDRLPTR
ncbi:hypothetical protein LTR56_018731 [Elasticomyces elasticus]|nr:hypothetical protein LTR56_018731 [Elasticomyces elasticus]KAK3635958.1 hypothetical protein LTR22_018951 [Elasticomyces elasticus]KAK4911957.1 hypothetical protein LTR49_019519 [Elasticomyces elasticus]KAK5751493.1 hypothetical protein LTS12_018416 [Elasticomyces elasticus]